MNTFGIVGLLIALSFACLPTQVLAWGSDGHRISGTIAQTLLSAGQCSTPVRRP